MVAAHNDRGLEIPGAPTLGVRGLVGAGRRAGLPQALSGRVSFYHQGRYAFCHGLRLLNLRKGDAVALPALHCGVELGAVAHLGLRPLFYDVGESLRVTAESLDHVVSAGARAVLVIHYFGLPQELAPLRESCARRRVALIEDCAHLLGLGSCGDVAIFSMRKILPLPDGGALRLNRHDLPLPPRPLRRQPLAMTARIAGGRLLRRLGWRWRRETERRPDASAAYDFRPERLTWGMSWLSARILRGTDLRPVTERRRANAQVLASLLGHSRAVRPLHISWPQEACPWVFPVLANDADRCIAHLRSRGIDVGRFWQFTHPLFPAADHREDSRLKAQLVGLPIHQDLRADDMERIAAAVATVPA